MRSPSRHRAPTPPTPPGIRSPPRSRQSLRPGHSSDPSSRRNQNFAHRWTHSRRIARGAASYRSLRRQRLRSADTRRRPVIDLGISYGFPRFELILDELTIEAAWGSRDVAEPNPEAAAVLGDRLNAELIDHDDFEQRIRACRFVVRTRAARPYATVLLPAGEPWL
ncbi:RbsD/FucU domain-containing protein [Nocardia sp. R16R-3T]